MNIFDLKDRVVVITGGLGQLGTQFALGLEQQGARIVLLDLDEPQPEHSKLLESDKVMYLKADVTSRDSLENALATIRTQWDAPFGLINNAALDSPPGSAADTNGPLETFPTEVWNKTMNVNVTGVLLCCQVFGRAMKETGRGSIVNICSIYGIVSPDQDIYGYRREQGDDFYKPISYTASKSALRGMTKYMATYWAKSGIRVNTLTLGGVFNHQDKQFLENYTAKVPLGRMANGDEYNGAVCFLMSDASSYMTGSNMVLDGGWMAL